MAGVGHNPRVVFCGKADAQRLVWLHNEGKLYQSLSRPTAPHWLRLAVKRACEDYAMRSELRRLRAAREWSQADLAQKLDVSRQTVNALETGRYDPSLPLAFKISAAFKEPIETLFIPAGDNSPAHI